MRLRVPEQGPDGRALAGYKCLTRPKRDVYIHPIDTARLDQ
jgi:hypothetical protein